MSSSAPRSPSHRAIALALATAGGAIGLATLVTGVGCPPAPDAPLGAPSSEAGGASVEAMLDARADAIGDGAAQASETRGDAAVSAPALGLATGPSHVCALLADATVKCWGRMDYGPLGDLLAAPIRPPTALGVDRVARVSAECVLRDDGEARCWGSNVFGHLGCGGCDYAAAPTTIPSLAGARAIADGRGTYHRCAQLADGTARCWGDATFGQIGDGGAMQRNLPTAPAALGKVTQIAVGALRTCVIVDAGGVPGAVYCWGQASNFVVHRKPTRVKGLDHVVRLSMAGDRACVVRDDGTVRCWEEPHAHDPPGPCKAKVTGFRVCVCATDGKTPSCYENPRPTPPTAIELPPVVDVDVSEGHACALLADATVRCWGKNDSGQLGDGTTVDRAKPVQVVGLNDVAQIVVGEGVSCAREKAGAVRCWGTDAHGELGDGKAGAASEVPLLVGL